MRSTYGRVVAAASFGALATILTAGVSQAAPVAQDAAVTVTPTIGSVVVGGPGCSGRTFTTDGDTLTIDVPALTVRAGVGTVITDSRSNCQLNINASVPDGYTYTVDKAVYSGTTSLTAGASAKVTGTYYFSGKAETGRVIHRLATAGDATPFTVTDTADELTPLGTATCGSPEAVNVNAALAVDSRSDSPVSTASLTKATITLKAVPC